MPGVFELLLLDRPGDSTAERLTLQDLKGWNFIDTDDPDALFGKPRRIRIAPKDLLRPLLEPGVEARCLPVTCAMGLQIDIVQNPANRCGTDRRDDLVVYCLARQILTGP